LGLSSEQYLTNSLIIRRDNLDRKEVLDITKLILNFQNLDFDGLDAFLSHKQMLKLLDELLEEFKSDIDSFFDEEL
jgi:hypothetical protein